MPRASSRRARVAVLGGTFDGLHAGHRDLLAAAFAAGDEVRVGLTSAAYLAEHPKLLGDRIAGAGARRRELEGYLRSTYPRRRWAVRDLDDTFGGSVAPDVEVLVVSEETRRGGEAVNDERRRRGLPPVRLVVVPTRFADDRQPVSSSRIRSGAIDADGHRTGDLVVRLPPGFGPLATEAVRTAFRRAIPGVPRARLRFTVGAASGAGTEEYVLHRPPGGPSRGVVVLAGGQGAPATTLRVVPTARFATELSAELDRRLPGPRARTTRTKR